MKGYEDINSWIKAKELTLFIYNKFRNSKDYGFKDQIQRASISIMNNIAEGYDGRNRKQEFIHFLTMSKGSCSEVQSMVHISKDLQYTNENEFDYLYNLSTEISKLISGLIKYLKKS